MKMQLQLLTLALIISLAGTSVSAQTDQAPRGEADAHTEHGDQGGEAHAEGEDDEAGHQEENGHEEEEHEEGAGSEADHAEEAGHEEGGGEENGHKEEGHEEEASGVVELDSEGQRLADIQAERIVPQPVPTIVSAPGEVELNAYRSARATTRIAAQVVSRQAQLGETVEENDPLALLTSVEMAEAQGALQVTTREWERVRQLGKSVVGEGRYVEAQVAFEQAQSKLLAYGMTEAQVDRFLRNEDKLKLGQFGLLAPIAGTIVEDDFVVGQYVEAGASLFFIADESSVWVEATVAPAEARTIEVGAPARVRIGQEWHQGKVVQKQHRLNESTRTVPVRIELALEEEHAPHPGEFVEVAIEADPGKPGMLVPERALNRNSAGEWVVFIEEASGKYRQVDVKRLKDLAGKVEISGVEPGSMVVTDGAFYLNSEIAKSGFSVHNH